MVITVIIHHISFKILYIKFNMIATVIVIVNGRLQCLVSVTRNQYQN